MAGNTFTLNYSTGNEAVPCKVIIHKTRGELSLVEQVKIENVS
jgi:hypothetical protein